MAKRFTLNEAQSLIPRVESLLRQAMALKSEYEEAERAIQAFTQRVMMMGGMSVNREQAAESRNRRESAARQLREAIEQVQELGCMVKDLDTGLVDFPTLFRGEEVLLCWKLGEPAIEYWHGMDEGFRGRKAIDTDFLEHHEGDRAQ
jgi:hypothetical protein